MSCDDETSQHVQMYIFFSDNQWVIYPLQSFRSAPTNHLFYAILTTSPQSCPQLSLQKQLRTWNINASVNPRVISQKFILSSRVFIMVFSPHHRYPFSLPVTDLHSEEIIQVCQITGQTFVRTKIKQQLRCRV